MVMSAWRRSMYLVTLVMSATLGAMLSTLMWRSSSASGAFSIPSAVPPEDVWGAITQSYIALAGDGRISHPAAISHPAEVAPLRLAGVGLAPAGISAIISFVIGIRHRDCSRLRRTRGATISDPAQLAAKVPTAVGMFCNFFAVWLAIAAVVAVRRPSTFLWVKPSSFTVLLGLLMFSVGITTTLDDFRRCATVPGAVGINFLCCYGIMPALACLVAKAIGAEGPMLAGLVFLGSINGGQSSNLCTLIAGGDVALSVLMTTSTTMGCIVMTPMICKVVLGAVVPVDAVGIILSTIKVLLVPIFFGVAANTFAPKLCRLVSPYTPTLGVTATVLLVGSSVASCAPAIEAAGAPLQLACVALHLLGGICGYIISRAFKFNEKISRTVAIETAMKSSAFAYLLASHHFGAFTVRVPSAVSVAWNAIMGSLLAIYWKKRSP